MRAVLCLLLCARLAHAETPLRFAARVDDEALAEETILLVHCLAERTGRGWEFTGDASGPYWLSAREKDGKVEGTYHRDGKDTAFQLEPNGADAACDRLEPTASSTAPAPRLAPVPRAALDVEAGEPAPSRRTWLWVAGAALVVGGLVYWKSREPSYRSVEMR
jgi:hypothetical protein